MASRWSYSNLYRLCPFPIASPACKFKVILNEHQSPSLLLLATPRLYLPSHTAKRLENRHAALLLMIRRLVPAGAATSSRDVPSPVTSVSGLGDNWGLDSDLEVVHADRAEEFLEASTGMVSVYIKDCRLIEADGAWRGDKRRCSLDRRCYSLRSYAPRRTGSPLAPLGTRLQLTLVSGSTSRGLAVVSKAEVSGT